MSFNSVDPSRARLIVAERAILAEQKASLESRVRQLESERAALYEQLTRMQVESNRQLEAYRVAKARWREALQLVRSNLEAML
jgi:hypothetical protein